MALKLGLSFGRSRKAKPKSRPVRSVTYHAVAIQSSRDACAAARAANGKRVLADEAPMLPLANCDRPVHCACRYQHYVDRRGKPRRQADGATPSASPVEQDVDRRAAVERRAEDRLDVDVATDEAPLDHAGTYFDYHGKS